MKRLNGLLQRELTISLPRTACVRAHPFPPSCGSHLAVQESRTQELRETHKLESTSQSSQLETLRTTLKTTQSTLSSLQSAHTALLATHTASEADLTKARASTKEEEEKRTKAISLLKTVRQKLVKADQTKEEALADRETMRVAMVNKEEENKKEIEKVRNELERVRGEREKDVRGLREKFEGEVKGLRTSLERENRTRREEAELKAVTTAVRTRFNLGLVGLSASTDIDSPLRSFQATHAKELQTVKGRLTTAQTTITDLTAQKSSLFDQLQARQADLEGSSAENEALLVKISEVQFQLREAHERVSTLEEELADSHKSSSSKTNPSSPISTTTTLNGAGTTNASSSSSMIDLQRQLASTSSAYESKLSELRSQIRRLESERSEAEEEWSRNVQERTKEVERLRGVVEGKDREYEEAVRSRRVREEKVGELEGEKEGLKREVERERRKGEEGWERCKKVQDDEVSSSHSLTCRS